MQVGEPLNRIGKRLLVDLGVLGADAVADGAVGGGGECEIHGVLRTSARVARYPCRVGQSGAPQRYRRASARRFGGRGSDTVAQGAVVGGGECQLIHRVFPSEKSKAVLIAMTLPGRIDRNTINSSSVPS